MGSLGWARLTQQVSSSSLGCIHTRFDSWHRFGQVAHANVKYEECIAAYTKRPLMVLTSSDLGTDPTRIELNLARHFKTATSWGAVLLIDEADVFLERRGSADLVRNSLVAGEFLKHLETLCLTALLLRLKADHAPREFIGFF